MYSVQIYTTVCDVCVRMCDVCVYDMDVIRVCVCGTRMSYVCVHVSVRVTCMRRVYVFMVRVFVCLRTCVTCAYRMCDLCDIYTRV